jgi:thiol-disulfide isomerase/thioredoxin
LIFNYLNISFIKIVVKMKKILLTIVAVLSIITIQAQGIEFFRGSFKEAVERAQKEDKLIFMDAFAEWCGPCKRMAATTFKDEKVGKFFNDNFVNIKVDMEKGEGPELAGKFPVRAYPTLMFINGKGELEKQSVGALDATGLMNLANSILKGRDNSQTFEKAYNEGNRDPELVLNYIKALNRAGKPSAKIANEYLMKADMSQPTTLKIIFEGTTQADSKIFDMLVKNKTPIAGIYSEQQIKDKIKDACEKTLETAVQFKNAELHKEAKARMKQYMPEAAERFAIDADLKYFKATGNAKEFCEICETYFKKEAKNDARKLFSLGKQVIDAFPKDKTALTLAEKSFKKAAENGGLCEYYFWHAQAAGQLGKKKDALMSAERALQLAKEGTPNLVPMCEQLLENLKEQG